MGKRWRIGEAVEWFTGFADVYDKYRPLVPEAVVDVLAQIAGTRRPQVVVDLGCGTGLSTRIWAGRARQVFGIDC